MSKDEITYYAPDIPFSHLPLYQLLAKKHDLKLSNAMLFTYENIPRIKFLLSGTADNKQLFIDDLGHCELHEDRLDTLFSPNPKKRKESL